MRVHSVPLETLTPRQRQVFSLIQELTRIHGYPPSVRELGAALGLRSSSTVHRHLKALENKGLLHRLHNKPRAIGVTPGSPFPSSSPEFDPSVVHVPILGRVAAGVPLLAEENLQGTFPLPGSYASKEPLFFLRIKGESMIDAGILDGDYVLVRQQPVVENGEIAVVLIDNQATVKGFYKEKDKIILRPANPIFKPIVADAAEVLGRVIGVFRFLLSGE